MPRNITIHKPTHKWFAPGRGMALAIGQLRGDMLHLNRIGSDGAVVEKSRAVGACARHMTGYGDGVGPSEPLAQDQMHNAWRYTFGADAPLPEWCERHTPARGKGV